MGIICIMKIKNFVQLQLPHVVIVAIAVAVAVAVAFAVIVASLKHTN